MGNEILKNSLFALFITVLTRLLFAGPEQWNLQTDLKFNSPSQEQQQFEIRSKNIFTSAQHLKEHQQYSACMDETQKVSPESSWYGDARQLWLECRSEYSQELLRKAKALADRGSYKDAIAVVEKIPDGKISEKAQQMIDEWSHEMFQIADGYLKDANDYFEKSIALLNDAQAVFNAIPEESSFYSDAKGKVNSLQLCPNE